MASDCVSVELHIPEVNEVIGLGLVSGGHVELKTVQVLEIAAHPVSAIAIQHNLVFKIPLRSFRVLGIGLVEGYRRGRGRFAILSCG